MDANSLVTAFPEGFNTNHQNQIVNVLYDDGRVRTWPNGSDLRDGVFSVRDADLADIIGRLRQVFVHADFAPRGEPTDAPDAF